MPDLTAAGVAAGVALLASPYLAGLTVTAPNRDLATWWRPHNPGLKRIVVTAAAAGALGALAGLGTGFRPELAAYLVLAAAAAVLSIADIEHHRLPNRILAAAALAGAALLIIASASSDNWDAPRRAAIAAVAVGGVFYVAALISPRGVGLGDVKLAALLAGYLAWMSWPTAIAGLAVGFLAAGVFSIAALAGGRANRTSQIPLGPFLLIAALVAVGLHP